MKSWTWIRQQLGSDKASYSETCFNVCDKPSYSERYGSIVLSQSFIFDSIFALLQLHIQTDMNSIRLWQSSITRNQRVQFFLLALMSTWSWVGKNAHFQNLHSRRLNLNLGNRIWGESLHRSPEPLHRVRIIINRRTRDSLKHLRF